jgi:hypothetical protein
MAGMAGMAEWQKEWLNGRMAEVATYVLFMVHANDNDNDDDTLIFYITDGLAESSTVLFQNFDDQFWNWSTIELPRNGVKRKCKLLKSCQVNASTKTGRKGCAGKCLETVQ